VAKGKAHRIAVREELEEGLLGQIRLGDRIRRRRVDVGLRESLKRGVPTDVLMTVRAPVGEINVADREYCAGRGVAIIRSRHPAYAEQLMPDAVRDARCMIGHENACKLQALGLAIYHFTDDDNPASLNAQVGG